MAEKKLTPAEIKIAAEKAAQVAADALEARRIFFADGIAEIAMGDSDSIDALESLVYSFAAVNCPGAKVKVSAYLKGIDETRTLTVSLTTRDQLSSAGWRETGSNAVNTKAGKDATHAAKVKIADETGKRIETNEYSFGKGGRIADTIGQLAVDIAIARINAKVKAKGGKKTQKELKAMAERLVEKDPQFRNQAKAEIARRDEATGDIDLDSLI